MQYNHTRSTSLADAITKAERAIDAAAGDARAKYLTIAPGQEATYLAKAQDADKFIADGEPVDLTGYSWVSAEVNATGLTASQAAAAIRTQRDQWYAIGSYIEQLRLSGKAQVRAATTIQQVAQIRHSTITALKAV